MSSCQADSVAYVPYGYHAIVVGTSKDHGSMIFIPLCHDKLLQDMDSRVLKEVVAMNVDFANVSEGGVLGGSSRDFRHWLSRAA